MKSDFKAKSNKFKSSFGKKAEKDIVKYKSEIPNIESDAQDEINHIHKEFGKSKQKEIDHYKEQTSTDYYSVIFFKNKAQRQQFYELAKILDIVDESGRFIKGESFAEKLNIPLSKVDIKKTTNFKVNKRFNSEEFFNN